MQRMLAKGCAVPVYLVDERLTTVAAGAALAGWRP